MRHLNLDSTNSDKSNLEIYNIIKIILSQKEVAGVRMEAPYKRKLLISDCIRGITDEQLLNPTIQFLKECGLLKNESQIANGLVNIFQKTAYSEDDKITIKAFFYGILLEYETIISQFTEIKNQEFTVLTFDVNDRIFKCNIDEIIQANKNTSQDFMVNKIEALPLIEKKREYNKAIRSMNKIDRNEHTSFFDSDIKYFSVLRDTCDDEIPPIDPVFNINPHPRMFPCINSFKLFESLKENIGKNVLADYSFIFRQMRDDKLIFENIKDTEFRDWLGEIYDVSIDKTKQLPICSPPLKVKLYNILKDIFKPYNI